MFFLQRVYWVASLLMTSLSDMFLTFGNPKKTIIFVLIYFVYVRNWLRIFGSLRC